MERVDRRSKPRKTEAQNDFYQIASEAECTAASGAEIVKAEIWRMMKKT